MIFSLAQYEAAANAYIAGLEKYISHGGDPSRLASVASFFVSRVDTEADKRLDEAVAKAQFREAISRLKNLTLTPDRFSPRVINVLESVKEESRATNGPPAPGAPAPRGSSSPAPPLAIGCALVVADTRNLTAFVNRPR